MSPLLEVGGLLLGGYDVLALAGGCGEAGGSQIVVGENLSAAAGVEVSTRFTHLRRRIPM